jgi:predicted RecB family endonuclease
MTLREARQIFLDNYDDVGVAMSVRFVTELEQQGHRATGALVRSVVVKVAEELRAVELQLSHLEYGVTVNTGLKPSEVPRTLAFIKQIAAWVKFRKIAGGLDKTIEKVAVRIVKTMWRTGMPTPGSYRFSNNGRRTGWIDWVYAKYRVEWQDQIEPIAQDYIENAFNLMLLGIGKEYRYITVKIR